MDLAQSLYNFFTCSTWLIMKFIILINVKMSTIVGILTFMSMINTASESLKSLFFSILKINQKLWSVTLFTLLICCSRKEGFRRLFTFTAKTLTYTCVPVGLAHFTHSASIIWIRKTQRSLVRGRGTSVVFMSSWNFMISWVEHQKSL